MTMFNVGKIELIGSVNDITNSENPVVRQFINGEVEGPISFR